MENDNKKVEIKKKPKRKVLKVIGWTILAIIVVLILAIVVGVPAYVSSDSCRQMILAKANAGGIGTVGFSKLSMGWGKGISVSNITYKDKAEGVSVAVKDFSTKPKYGALLTGNIALGETVIDEPRVEINVDKMKPQEKEKAAATEKPKAEAKSKEQAGIPISQIDLLVKNGDVTISKGKKVVEIAQLNSSVNLKPEGEKSTFGVNANLIEPNKPGAKESTISAKGEVNPGKNWDLSKTAGDVTIEIGNLDLTKLESILAIAGVEMSAKGMVSGNIKAAIKNGTLDNAQGKITGSGLEITMPALKGDTIKTNVLDIEIAATKSGELLNVDKLTAKTDWLTADAKGTAPMNIASLDDFLKPGSQNEIKANVECDIPAIAAQLPNTLGMKKDTKITGGKLVASVATITEGQNKKLSAQVSLEGVSGTVSGKPASIPEPIKVQALISAEGKVFKFEKAGLTSGFANMNCTGTMESFNYDMEADLVKMADQIGQFADISEYKLAGQIDGKGQITNNENATTVTNSSNITNLKVSPTKDITINEPSAKIDLNATIDKKKQALQVKEFKAQTSFGLITLKDASMPMSNESKEPMGLTASAKDVNLAKLQPYLVMSKAISKDVQLGGMAEADITAVMKDGVYKVKTENTKITNLLVKSADKTPFVESQITVNIDAEANPTTMVWSIKADIDSPDIKIKGNFQQKPEGQNNNLQGNAQLDYDWKSISGLLSPYMPEGFVIQGKRKDTITISSKYPKTDPNAMLANLNTQTKVGFDKLSYKGLNLGQTNVDIKVEQGLLTIAPFTTVANSGQINFGGSADFKKTPTIFRTPGPLDVIKDVQINDVVANMLLSKINPIFANASKVSGNANMKIDKLAAPIIGGKPDDYDIAGSLSLTQVQMQSPVMSALMTAVGGGNNVLMIHPSNFTVNKGFVKYTNMQMDIGNLPFYYTGTLPVDPNGKIKDMSVELPVSGLGKVIRTTAQASPGQGSKAYFKGTTAKPELDLGKTLQDQAVKTGIDMLLQEAGKSAGKRK